MEAQQTTSALGLSWEQFAMTDLTRSTRTTRGTSTARSTARKVTLEAEVSRRISREDERWDGSEPADFRFDDDDVPSEDFEAELEMPVDDDPSGEDEADGAWDGPGRAHLPPASITLWIEGGVPAWSVRPPDPAKLIDPQLSSFIQSRQRRLEWYAAGLAGLRQEGGPFALEAPTLAEVWDRLPVLTQDGFARRWAGSAAAVGNSQVSKDVELLVEIPAGTVTLGFFFWKNDSDSTIALLARHPDLDASIDEIDAFVRGSDRMADSSKYVRWVRLTRRHSEVVAAFRAQFARDPREADRLVERFTEALASAEPAGRGSALARTAKGKPVTNRSSAVLKRALVGGLS